VIGLGRLSRLRLDSGGMVAIIREADRDQVSAVAKHQGRVDLFEVVMPAFLAERVQGDPRIQNCVKIDIDQVVEVLDILARHGIAGLIREGQLTNSRGSAAQSRSGGSR
jgi:hypothetical protein